MRFYMKDNFCTVYKLSFHRMQQFLVANGWTVVSTPQEADVLIAGVCAAFEADEERSCVLLHSLEQINKELYVIGCMVRVRPDKMPHAHLFYAWEYKELLADLVVQPSVSWERINLPTDFRCHEDYRVYNPKRRFVGISMGCAFDCSFCPHKLGAGELVSRPMEEIIDQIQGLLQQDIKTIVLTGIDTASYGKDIGCSFPVLMKQILSLTNTQVCYHIAQFNPEGIASQIDGEGMVRCCCNPHVTDLQLPIQTTSSRLLKLMNRNYTASDIASFIEQVHYRNDRLFFRTDLLVGFPLETEEELHDSLKFAIRYFNEAAVYKYEHRVGTPIATASLPAWDSKIVDRRIQEATRLLGEAGLLVHSGGQKVPSLLLSDQAKEQMREIKGRKYKSGK